MRADTWAVTVLLVWPVGVAGQVDRLVGPIVGYSINHQMWKPEAESDGVGGPMVGIRVETGTPVAGLAGTLELVYTQRGGDVDTTGEGAFEGAVRSDYLCLSLRPTLRFGVGPVALHIGLGPAMDMLVRSRIAPGFEGTLDESERVFGMIVATGVDVGIGGGRLAGLQVRLFEGVSDAYSGDLFSLRNRSWEIVGRLGFVLDR